jgi:predicted site-specific integrase-resolvase
MHIEPEELIPSAGVAELLGVRPQTLVQWRHEGRGPAFLKIGRLAYYRRQDVTAYLGTLLRQPEPKSEKVA